MIAEILLVLAGHKSSIFPESYKVHPDIVSLLHPGERQCLESLGLIAHRYRRIKAACSRLSQSPSRYICALCAKTNEILRDEYEVLVASTEAKILSRDENYVGKESFVPLSSIRATFSEWDGPLASLESLMHVLEERNSWSAGPLIDVLLNQTETGIDRISRIMARLAESVERVWMSQLKSFLVHGSTPAVEPIAVNNVLIDDAIPRCVSSISRDSIMYIGRAIATVKESKWHKQIPSSMGLDHARLLEATLPQDRHNFDHVVAHIRGEISEWLWTNVLTVDDVVDAVDSLANYFLLQNGEFSLSLTQEIDRMKDSRLRSRSAPTYLVREQDLQLALLRASLGTSAQHDPALSRLRFRLPSGPAKPLLTQSYNLQASSIRTERTIFDDILLGTSLRLTYTISWPLDLFLQRNDLSTYGDLFAYLSSLRHIQTRVHTCWTSLSNAQRARRRWTGLDEGGTQDSEARKDLLRCSWGVVRLMGWFFDVLLGYLMNDVVESEYKKFKASFKPGDGIPSIKSNPSNLHKSGSAEINSASPRDQLPTTESLTGNTGTFQLDFTTLRTLHATYLDRLMSATLLNQPAVTATIRAIIDVCERFTGKVERWGGDVLPALLFEGSISDGADDAIGNMVKERWDIVRVINRDMRSHLEVFYSQLSSTSTVPFNVADPSKSGLINSTNLSGLNMSTKSKARVLDRDGETKRHVERLLLRLDFNRSFSNPSSLEPTVPKVHDGDNRILQDLIL